ncbi:MAG TPA: F0F1 ATP synthase subunit B [Bacteroidales bacterium]|nr:F0F1 ATP synthase subunit B [Bacteroidales bacterium]
MDLLIPETGTIIWSFIGFLITFLILAKFAWKPLLKGLKERDNSIAQALQAAELAKKDVSMLHSESEKLLAEAKAERDKIMQEARAMKDSLLNEAREQAKKEGHKLLDEARTAIKNERAAAIQDIRKQVAELSVSISEKILMHELEDSDKQRELIDKSIVEAKLN